MDLIGKMKSVVSFYTNTPASQGAGNTDGYVFLLETRGYLRRDSGNRSLQVAEITTDARYLLTVRYQQLLATNIALSMKIMISGVRYTISSYSKKDERDDYFDFVLFKKEL